MTRTNPLIALSDDEPAFMELYAAMLEGAGYRTVALPDKRDLLERLNLLRPDLVITDIYSPGMNGMAFLRSAKAASDTKDIPVIVTTLHGEYMNEALDSGACNFVTKPFDIEEFIDTVKAALIYSPWREIEN